MFINFSKDETEASDYVKCPNMILTGVHHIWILYWEYELFNILHKYTKVPDMVQSGKIAESLYIVKFASCLTITYFSLELLTIT